jgi:hypothetical protein
MNRKALERVRAVNVLKRAAAEARRSQLASGIADGIALRDLYQAKDCGVGLLAELGMSNVARTLNTIERGLSALRERESAAGQEIMRFDHTLRRIEGLIAEAAGMELRQETDRELQDLGERAFGPYKSDASESQEKLDDELRLHQRRSNHVGTDQ